MQQFANMSFFGVIGAIHINEEKQYMRVLMNVNMADSYGYHQGHTAFYVFLKESAFKSIFPVARVGDFLYVREATPRIDLKDKTVYIEVKYSSKSLLVPKGTHTSLVERANKEIFNNSTGGLHENIF